YSDDECSSLRSVRGAGPSYNPAFLRVAASGESQHLEITERRKDGSALELELHGIPMHYQGKPHVLTIARDITQKKRDAAEQQPPERSPVALNDVVSAALDIASYAVRTSGIDVKLDLAPDIPLILADADQLHQVFLNLIINAQQSLQEQPLPRRIRVTSRFITSG